MISKFWIEERDSEGATSNCCSSSPRAVVTPLFWMSAIPCRTIYRSTLSVTCPSRFHPVSADGRVSKEEFNHYWDYHYKAQLGRGDGFFHFWDLNRDGFIDDFGEKDKVAASFDTNGESIFVIGKIYWMNKKCGSPRAVIACCWLVMDVDVTDYYRWQEDHPSAAKTPGFCKRCKYCTS